MTSSGFIGFTPTTWLKYAEPEVLRYIYLKPPPKRRIVLGLDKIPNYVADFDKAQRIYFGLEPFNDSPELQTIRRSYEITYYDKVPEYQGFQLDYQHAIILSQLVSSNQEGTEQAITKLQTTGILTTPLTKEGKDYIHQRLEQARAWVSTHGPAHLRIKLLEHLPPEFHDETDKKMIEPVIDLAKQLKTLDWTEEKIKQSMIFLRDKRNMSRKEMARFFAVLYKIFLGSSRGPRLAPFLAVLEKDWVLERLRKVKTS